MATTAQWLELATRQILLGFNVDRERAAGITVGGGKIRVEIERVLEFFNRLVGAPPRECHIAERITAQLIDAATNNHIWADRCADA